MSCRFIFSSFALCLLTLTPHAAEAQADSAGPSICWGFAFGAWTPKLDWRAAGHGAPPDTSKLGRAPASRGWAADLRDERDSSLLLFPVWWPVGVVVELPNRKPSFGDTIVGKATALIAYGDRTAPTSRVRAWAVECRR